jgi:uncharacterized membrane protein YoaK (UPF0700 family)
MHASARTRAATVELLPRLLLVLTLVTGIVDATSYLRLGHVFVANMTGNVVFLGFAMAGARGLSVPASLVAIAAFLVGGVVGGSIGRRWDRDHMRALRASVTIQAAAVTGAAVFAGIVGTPGEAGRYVLIGLLAVGMGVQNAVVRALAVPDLTTTVLTMTLTGVAADSRFAGGEGSRISRRGLAVAMMLGGAVIGALLVLHVGIWAPLAAAAVLLVLVGAAAHGLDDLGNARAAKQAAGE